MVNPIEPLMKVPHIVLLGSLGCYQVIGGTDKLGLGIYVLLTLPLHTSYHLVESYYVRCTSEGLL